MQMWIYLSKGVLIAACVMIAVTSCYRMPTEDDYSVIPMTNSPDVQRQESALTPNVGY